MENKLLSRLPGCEENVFQRIKRICAEAESRGVKLWRLSIGQPSGPAFLSARLEASRAVMSAEEARHEYQDNGSPGVPDFARRFVQAHLKSGGVNVDNISFLPIPGVKPMLGIIIQACGGINGEKITVGTMTNPGYPTPAVQVGYLGMNHYELTTNSENGFIVELSNINIFNHWLDGTDLLMLNYPHNPSGQIAHEGFWNIICMFCADNGIRLFNDAAYAALDHSGKHVSLADVAVGFSDLSWCEAFSASKVIGNGTGWRIGAMVGSSDFISDIATIKGNTDSGFFAPAATGVLHALGNDFQSVVKNRRMFGKRLEILIEILEKYGMKIAVKPRAGFFTLWLTPKRAFGEEIKNAEEFNNLMIQNTGIVGVPFGKYIRYAVTNPIDSPEWIQAIENAFNTARVSY
ncbi:aminotransferase class I/II-fold pyridoxal phosphate-dependent enzyme [Candidatus Wolfebacteria bacterium]|nr:aminotransferase class I/II-fold pyridoxal phosphate-dependent enzyme [Candidatus Wolfebacteria bacterium]